MIGPAMRVEMVNMYNGGLKPIEIAQEVGCSLPTVYRVLREEDVIWRRAAKLTDEQITEIVETFAVGEVTPRELAVKHGVSVAKIYTLLNEVGLVRRETQADREAKTKLLEEAVRMYLKGYRLWEIKEQTGVSANTLYTELHAKGIPTSRWGMGPKDVREKQIIEGSTFGGRKIDAEGSGE